ncbi:unnamed protein product [Acanthoscelides obtectus]|uniref:DDE Tnp4 domain-containing protein n=1 Tax=Acanthoscelides obtectus TaxID=200917 RepID=A0A9P0QDB1_ACAOB|nr:unnamed protein product [Acanthoscelides obtectus]CAK1652145.1 hypothetical protein AOBTE_LOCUS17711 [Acanthoscelides obtectus]
MEKNAIHQYSRRQHFGKCKRIFNYRLTRARRYVEFVFGILANKWRIFHRPLDIDKTIAVWTVKACTITTTQLYKGQRGFKQ